MLWPSGVFEVWEKMIRKVKTLEGVDFNVKVMSCQCLWYKGGGSNWNYEGRKDVDRRHKVIADIRTPPTAVTNLPLNSKRLYAFEQILCIHNLKPLSCTCFSVRCCGGKIEKNMDRYGFHGFNSRCILCGPLYMSQWQSTSFWVHLCSLGSTDAIIWLLCKM